MNPSDVQSETEQRYFDPEEIDMSEEQFAASLEISAEKPHFEIDEAGLNVPCEPAALAEPTPGTPASATDSVLEALAHEAGEHKADSKTTGGTADARAAQTGEAEPDWRDLVSAKVTSYKSRKPLKERYPSLKLQFDATAPRVTRRAEQLSQVEDVRMATEDAAVSHRETVFVPPPPQPDLPPRLVLEATARVIEFPRPAVKADELADPVIDRPRIVEAPELLPPPPAMGGILIEEQREPELERLPGFDVPLRSSALKRRIAAGLFDAAVVTLAMALFAYVFVRINGTGLEMRSAALFAAGLFAILWPAYQYAFLVFSGRTPGLCVTRLHVSRFDGQPVSRKLRCWRALASVLSLASLGLGYAWCFLDEDQLSWHDRITRTHLAS